MSFSHLEEGLDLGNELPNGPQRVPSAQLKQRVRRHRRGSEATKVRPDDFNAGGIERVEAALEADDQLASAELVTTLDLLHILHVVKLWSTCGRIPQRRPARMMRMIENKQSRNERDSSDMSIHPPLIERRGTLYRLLSGSNEASSTAQV